MKKSGGNKYFEGENLFVKNKQTNKKKKTEKGIGQKTKARALRKT